MKELTRPTKNLTAGHRPTPEIIEFLNMCDYTHQVESKVDVDEPLFQPFPPEVSYHKYDAFKTYEQQLWFRNNDYVPRRIKVEDPRSRHFSVKRVNKKGDVESGDARTGKVAPGMEVAYKVIFSPLDQEDYAVDLVVSTERERFIVPVRCIGNKPALDFPDVITMEPTAAKGTSALTRTVRNVGAKAAKFALFAPEPFSVSPSEGSLEVGECAQVTFGFAPDACGVYEGEMEIEMGEGLDPVVVALKGDGVELEVGLSSGKCECLPTFIHKTSQRTFKVVNLSDQIVRFEVKKLVDAYQEDEARMRCTGTFGDTLRGLADSYDERRGGATTSAGLGGAGGSSDGDSEGEDDIYGAKAVEFATRARGLDKALAADRLLFEDDDFTIYPLMGEVIPGGETEVTVKFHPSSAADISKTCYVDVQGRENRLPLTLCGVAVGPLCVFTYDVLDIGDIFVGAVHQYEVELLNRGEIEAEYRLDPVMTESGRKFAFEPCAGVLSVGQTQVVTVTLCSETLGDFDETFTWTMVGALEPVSIDFRGRIIGPKFSVDAEKIDFGAAAYGYRYVKDFTMHNACEIPMRFNLRVPEDVAENNGDGARELALFPQSGTILPFGKQVVNVELVSTTPRSYEGYSVIVDVPGVGDRLWRVPIFGECNVPRLSLPSPSLDFGPCFLRYHYSRRVELTNPTDFPAKFVIAPQDERSKSLALWTVTPESGPIAGGGVVVLTFTLFTDMVGNVVLPVDVRVLGSKARPMRMNIEAKSRGPKLVLSDEPDDLVGKWRAAIDFEEVKVLKKIDRTFYVVNDSLIPAEVKTFIGGADSDFSVDVRDKTLGPGESYPVTVSVFKDEVVETRDVLNVMVIEGKDFTIPLRAVGTGSLTTCDDVDVDNGVRMGAQFKDRPFTRELVVTNNGRRAQKLEWTNVTADEYRKAHFDAQESFVKAMSNKDNYNAEDDIVFRIDPPVKTLLPKSTHVFTLTGAADREGDVMETLVCRNKAALPKEQKEVMIVHASASVSIPLMEFSKSQMSWTYVHDPNPHEHRETRPLTMKNVSALPISFALDAVPPFFVDAPTWTLDPEESATVNVTFDPDYRGDRKSHSVTNDITIVYDDNPHLDRVAMEASIAFPNLKFSREEIDFGSVLNDTTKREHVTIRNSSAHCPARYEWVFEVEDEDPHAALFVKENVRISRVLVGETGAKRRVNIEGSPAKVAAPEEVFDVLPIRGELAPGEEEEVEISYFAQAHSKIRAVAVCEVEGGPAYEVALKAEGMEIKYKLDVTSVDFGRVNFNEKEERGVTLLNTGRVTFPFKVNVKEMERDVLQVFPSEGSLASGESMTFTLAFSPGIPEKIFETFTVDVAHFEPIEIAIRGEGVFQMIALSLPRDVDDEAEKFIEEATERLRELGPSDLLNLDLRGGVEEPPEIVVKKPDAEAKATTTPFRTTALTGLHALRSNTHNEWRPGSANVADGGYGYETGYGSIEHEMLRKTRGDRPKKPKHWRPSNWRPITLPTNRGLTPDMMRETWNTRMLYDGATARGRGEDGASSVGDGGDGFAAGSVDEREIADDGKYHPTDAEIAYEADRLRLKAELLRREKDRRDADAERAAAIERGEIPAESTSSPPQPPRSPGLGLSPRPAERVAPELAPAAVARAERERAAQHARVAAQSGRGDGRHHRAAGWYIVQDVELRRARPRRRGAIRLGFRRRHQGSGAAQARARAERQRAEHELRVGPKRARRRRVLRRAAEDAKTHGRSVVQFHRRFADARHEPRARRRGGAEGGGARLRQGRAASDGDAEGDRDRPGRDAVRGDARFRRREGRARQGYVLSAREREDRRVRLGGEAPAAAAGGVRASSRPAAAVQVRARARAARARGARHDQVQVRPGLGPPERVELSRGD